MIWVENPKALTALVPNTVNMFGEFNVGMLCTNLHMHQDMFDPDDKISWSPDLSHALLLLLQCVN